MLIASTPGSALIRFGATSFIAAALLSSVAACVTSQRIPQRSSTWSEAADVVSNTELKPGQWKAVLVSGARISSAFDAAAFDLGLLFRARGVTLVATALTGGGGDFNASHAGITQALGWLGNEQKACLFFATGHSDAAGLYLDNDRGHHALRPGELGRMLDKHCGDRPTVAIISGCDAGVFLEAAARRPNRILIAAAANGRDSYGARMGDRHVNFDRCLIAAIEAGAPTWREAFQRTLPCVREREAWLGVRPSDPQAFFGAAVVNLAIPGAAWPVAQE